MASKRVGAKLRRSFLANGAVAFSDSVVVAAPGGSQRVHVASVVVSTRDVDTVTFESGGSSVLWEVYTGLNGGGVLETNEDAWFVCEVGEALTVSSSASDDCSVLVGYWVA